MSNYRAGVGVQCARCGGMMDPSTATYDKGGNLMCRSCAALVTIAEGDQRAIGSLVSSAIAVPALGFLSWTCVNQFALVSILTLASGVGWILMVARADEYRRRMGGKFVPCLVGVIIGMLMGLGPLMLLGLNVLFSVLRATR
ncbi:MAG: hypothetical protein KIS78_31835 [Labilithrix sp.]|nr:hypothetical protein [Labilithrix sp.]MCW5837029.1 hypothetical protein [Labilithrix sp.]